MKELSLNILDIAENSLTAGSTRTEILIVEDESVIKVTIRDNGCGIKKEMCGCVADPFFTSRTVRNVGFGIPFFKMHAEQTGGNFKIKSRHISDYPENHGTVVEASFNKKHIDFMPLGNIAETIVALIQGHSDTDFYFLHIKAAKKVELNTEEIRQKLGNGVLLSDFKVLCEISNYLNEKYIKF